LSKNIRSISAIIAILRDNAIFLDVGANVGLHSIPIANAGYKVYSIEPARCNYERV